MTRNKYSSAYYILTMLFLLHCSLEVIAQTDETLINDQEMQYVEMAAEREEEMDMEDFLPGLNLKQKIHINKVTGEELRSIGLLTDQQVQALILHREKFGSLISKYELQSIEGWDIQTIRNFLSAIEPLISVEPGMDIKQSFAKGHSILLFRYGTLIEKTSGTTLDSMSATGKFLGGQERLLLRYRYNYKGLIQYNFLAEKDPGEQIKFSSFKLFDFNSLNFSFNKPVKWCDQLVIGDYAISMGQGLIQWQGFGFSKGAGSMNIKKQGPVLRSYGSSGESNFHRGIAARVTINKLKALVFFSHKKLDANIEHDTARSLLTSGLHRNQGEYEDRKSLRLLTGGLQIVSAFRKIQLGINAVYYNFSMPVFKINEPYNLYSLKGKSWNNYSVHYSRTLRNIHLFGEVATDRNLSIAQVHGAIISLHKNLDLSILYRNISQRFQSLYSRAFTENSSVNNETGIYTAVSARFRKFRVELYADQFHFSWLKYRVDAPSSGYEYASLMSWNPSKSIEWQLRFRYEKKQLNDNNDFPGTNTLMDVTRKNYRTQLNWNQSRQLLFRFRIEENEVRHGMVVSNGFLAFAESHVRLLNDPITAVFRLQYFEADDFNSRVYAYENDVQYGFSVPFFSATGWRYFLTARYTPSNKFLRRYLKDHEFHLSLKWSQSFFPFEKTIGSGPNLINGNKRSEIKLQLILERTG